MDLVNPSCGAGSGRGRRIPPASGAAGAPAAVVPDVGSCVRPRAPELPLVRGRPTNLAHAALDHHVAEGRGGQAALVYANERGDRRVFTYAQLRARGRRGPRRRCAGWGSAGATG